MASATDFSLEQLFAAESRGVFGFVLMRCGSRTVAEDITAQTFLDASRHAVTGGTADIGPGWLRVTARRRLIDHWRSLASHQRRVEAATAAFREESAPADDPDDRVQVALASLPDRQRAALTLRYLEEFSVSEVAEALEVGYKAAESLLSRARAAFEQAYGEVEIDG